MKVYVPVTLNPSFVCETREEAEMIAKQIDSVTGSKHYVVSVELSEKEILLLNE